MVCTAVRRWNTEIRPQAASELVSTMKIVTVGLVSLSMRVVALILFTDCRDMIF